MVNEGGGWRVFVVLIGLWCRPIHTLYHNFSAWSTCNTDACVSCITLTTEEEDFPIVCQRCGIPVANGFYKRRDEKRTLDYGWNPITAVGARRIRKEDTVESTQWNTDRIVTFNPNRENPICELNYKLLWKEKPFLIPATSATLRKRSPDIRLLGKLLTIS